MRKQLAEEVLAKSFDQSVLPLADTSGAKVAKLQAEQLTAKLSEDFGTFYEQQNDGAEQTDDILIMTIDGKGIVMNEKSLRECTQKAAKTEKNVRASLSRHRVKGVTIILDFVHVLEYLWDAAFCFAPQGGQDAEKFVQERALNILKGIPGQVAAGLRRKATLNGLTPEQRAPVDKCADYIQKHKNSCTTGITLRMVFQSHLA